MFHLLCCILVVILYRKDISNSNMDANGVAISSDQISKIKRMRHLNRISSSNRSHDRNLKNAFAIFNSIKHKLSINDTLIENLHISIERL